ncbi:hypothetical protein ACIRG5_47550 [Lentzea sp. NPDC102401]|uniref:hypothetical protein n=1 Tax=Lentzea sp. NPDC102401 TaxID=3364128 RepID=UPI003801EC11
MLVASKNKTALVRQLAPAAQVYELPNRPPRRRSRAIPMPIYSHAFRHAQRRLALGFDSKFVAVNVQLAIAAIQEYCPDIIVNDYHDTIRIAADAVGVPVVSFAMAHGLRSGRRLGDWKRNELIDRPTMECLDCFNEVRAQHGLEPYVDERETFEGVANLVPTCRELDPLQARAEEDLHVGPLSPAPVKKTHTRRRRPLVVSYLAEGNNRPESAYPETLASLVSQTSAMNFVVIGEKTRYGHWFTLGDTYRGLVSPDEYLHLLNNADVVITAGGTTLVHALERSVPVLCLPWTSSEAAWAIQAEQFGAGLLYPAYRQPLDWRVDPIVHSAIPIAGHWSTGITVAELSYNLERIIDEPKFRLNAATLADQLQEARSSIDLIDFIKGVVSA